MHAPFSAHGSLVLQSCPLAEGLDFRELDSLSSQRASLVSVLVTRSTEEQRFSPECYHPHYPGRFWSSWVFVEFAHFLDVMYFYIVRTSAEFTEICQKSLYEFCASIM